MTTKDNSVSIVGKILLIHHGGHRGGYGVCWDLRAKATVHSHAEKACKNYHASQFGILSVEQFATLEPRAKTYWNETTLHCGDKESAIQEANRLGLEIVTPAMITKILKTGQNKEAKQ